MTPPKANRSLRTETGCQQDVTDRRGDKALYKEKRRLRRIELYKMGKWKAHWRYLESNMPKLKKADELLAESKQYPRDHIMFRRLAGRAYRLRAMCTLKEKRVYRKMKAAAQRHRDEDRAHLAEHFAAAAAQVERKPPPMVWDAERRQWRSGNKWINPDDPIGMKPMRKYVLHLTPRKRRTRKSNTPPPASSEARRQEQESHHQ